jgi:chromosome segregation ATPase
MNGLTTSSTIAITALREATEQAATAQDALLRRVSKLEEDNARLKDDLDDAKTGIKLRSQDQELLKNDLDLEISSNKRLQQELDVEISSNKRLQQDIKEFESLDEEFQRLENILGNLQEKTEQCEDLEEQIEASKSNEAQFE